MNKMAIYNKLPIFAQNILCNFEGRRIKKARFGQDFWEILSGYEERNSWTYEEIAEYRNAKLRRMIEHCYQTVPYYRALFDEIGINYKEINRIEDLRALPILTKETVKERFDEFISTEVKRDDMVWSQTNGTTGSGFRFLTTNKTISEQWAVWWRYRKNLGISFDERCAVFGGKAVVPQSQNKPPFWRSVSPANQVYFSIYHLNEKNIKDYINALNSYKIKWIHGFPSAIALIAAYMVDTNLELNYKLEYITIGSENLLEHQKELIYKAFGVKPQQHYGLAEGVANISENSDGHLIVDEDFSAVEFVEMGNEGKHIIGTTLSNFAMPLLRYDTKDIAEIGTVWNDKQNWRSVLSIDGRKEDYIILKNGTKVGRLAHVFADALAVSEAQIYQKSVGEIVVRIVKNANYTNRDEQKIINNLKERLGSDIKLSIEYPQRIERTSTGKLRFVISEVKSN